MSQPDTTQKDPVSKFNGDWIASSWASVKYYSKTAIVLLFIINSVALALYGFELVRPSKTALLFMAAVSASFAAVVLFTYIHSGVKSSNKKKR